MHQGRRWHANEGILPAEERTGCRVQRKLQLDATITSQSHGKERSRQAMAEYQQSALIKSHTAARKWPFLPQEYIFFVIYISGSGCPLVSSRRHESQPCLPLTNNDAFLNAIDSHNALPGAPKTRKEKHQWRTLPSVCACVPRCRCACGGKRVWWREWWFSDTNFLKPLQTSKRISEESAETEKKCMLLCSLKLHNRKSVLTPLCVIVTGHLLTLSSSGFGPIKFIGCRVESLRWTDYTSVYTGSGTFLCYLCLVKIFTTITAVRPVSTCFMSSVKSLVGIMWVTLHWLPVT